MAEPVGLASGVLALAVFAFKSGKTLHDTIRTFNSHPRHVRELSTELGGLVTVLQELSETGNLDLDVDLSALTLTLEQCRRACDEVKTELLTYCSRSSVDRTSFRDWMKLKCSGGDGIEGFRQQLIGYKATINVALSVASLRTSASTAEAIQACRDLIVITTIDLEAHLEDIQQKLTTLTQRTNLGQNPDMTVRQCIEEERRSTEKSLQFCNQLSQHIDQMQVRFFSERCSPGFYNPDSTSSALFGEGLEACKNHLHFTLAQLERHRQKVAGRLDTDPTATVSAEDKDLLNKLNTDAQALRQSLVFCSNVDEYLKGQISNIENHAEGDDTIQFMVSTNGMSINGKNRGIGLRLKQAGGHFDETSLQHMSQDFKNISLHQLELKKSDNKHSTQKPEDDAASAEPESPFRDRHGRGFTLASKGSASLAPPTG